MLHEPAFAYGALLLLHVLLFVYWLGADLAVLYGARFAADASLSKETRATISQIMAFVDLFPRLSLPLTGAVGMQLAVTAGYLQLPGYALAGGWCAATVWAANNFYIYCRRRTPAKTALSRAVDPWYRAAVAVILTGAAIAGLAGYGPLNSVFLATKVLVYAAAIYLSLVLRRFFLPYRPALNRIVAGDGGEEDERIMQRTLARTRPVVLGLWACTVLAAALGIAGGRFGWGF